MVLRVHSWRGWTALRRRLNSWLGVQGGELTAQLQGLRSHNFSVRRPWILAVTRCLSGDAMRCWQRLPTARIKMQNLTKPLWDNGFSNLQSDSSPTAIVMTDSHGTIEALDHVAEFWFGYEENELLGNSIDVIFPTSATSDDTAHSVCTLSQLGVADPKQCWLLQACRKDGSTFPTQVTVNSLVTTSGDSRLANVIDLSPRTPGIRDMAGEYSDQGGLHQERWIQRERLAAVMQMVSGLSHESRNALQRAQSCLDLLQLDLADQTDLVALTDQIRDALKDIHRNYEEVKSYAAPIMLKRTVVDLGKLCQSTFDELTASLGEHSPQLTVRCDATCESVKLDADRMGDVIRHVLENAIHASQPDGVIDFICNFSSIAGAPGIEIHVRDHGEGVTEEVEVRMFEPFFTTKLQGTGLGLAVCRRNIQAHHGIIEAANHPEGGVLVEISLPTDTVVDTTLP